MKRIILILCLLVSLSCSSQNYRPRSINIDSLKSAWNKGIMYDSFKAVVTYINKEAVQQTDTCIIYLEAKKCYIFYNFGQFSESAVKIFEVGNYIVFPNWEIFRCLRIRENESLYKARIIKFKTIKNK